MLIATHRQEVQRVKLRNEFVVAAPLERAWETLLDIERVANFLPGAVIEGSDADGAFVGTMRIKLGPMVIDYRGTARLGTVDEDTHTASMEVEAVDQKGQGGASAVIHNRLVQENGRNTRDRRDRASDHRAPGAVRPRDHAGRGRAHARPVRQSLRGVPARVRGARVRRRSAGARDPGARMTPAPATPAPVARAGRPAPQRPRESGLRGLPNAPSAVWAAAGALAAVTLISAASRRHRRRGFELEVGFRA